MLGFTCAIHGDMQSSATLTVKGKNSLKHICSNFKDYFIILIIIMFLIIITSNKINNYLIILMIFY